MEAKALQEVLGTCVMHTHDSDFSSSIYGDMYLIVIQTA